MCVQLLSLVWLFVTSWTIVPQAVSFRQEYWSGLPLPILRDFPNPRIKPASLALSGRFFTTLPPWEAHVIPYFLFLISFSSLSQSSSPSLLFSSESPLVLRGNAKWWFLETESFLCVLGPSNYFRIQEMFKLSIVLGMECYIFSDIVIAISVFLSSLGQWDFLGSLDWSPVEGEGCPYYCSRADTKVIDS